MRSLLEKLLKIKIIRYALVGGSVAAADVVFFYIFAKLLSFNYLWVNAIGFVLGTLANYLLSIRLVFKSGAGNGTTASIW